MTKLNFLFSLFPLTIYCILHFPLSLTLSYVQVHGYLSLLVCIFGSIANFLNIAVLTRRDMRSPTNTILTGLAIADLLVMFEYIPYTVNEYLFPQFHVPRETQRSYGWAVVALSHSFFSQTSHTISIFLTVTLAVWRYIAIAHPQKNRAWCNMRNTLITIATSYIVCPMLCITMFLCVDIVPQQELHAANGTLIKMIPGNAPVSPPPGAKNATVYMLKMSDLVRNNLWIWDTNLWIFSVIIKIIPSIALTVLSLRLVGALLEAKRRRKQLMGHSKVMRPIITTKDLGQNGGAEKTSKKQSRVLDKERQTDRTTRMLLAVLVLFLITEIPQGILGLISTVSVAFFNQCYLKMGE